MSRRCPDAGFVGNLTAFGAVEKTRRGVVHKTRLVAATVTLPKEDLDPFHRAIGMPVGGVDITREPDACPAVALIPAEHPRHPSSHDDVLFRAALTALERLVDAAGEPESTLRLDPRTVYRVMLLERAVCRQPLHVPAEGADGL